jgi:hypothetical protein
MLIRARGVVAAGLVCSLVHAVAASMPPQATAQEPTRLVVVSNARLREKPSEEVRIVATVPLGTELIELEQTPNRAWVRVRTDDGREGWMLDALSRRVPPGQFLRIAEDVIRERLQRNGDGFASWIELEGFIDRVRQDVSDRETAARLTLARLQTIRSVAAAGQRFHRPVPPAFATWLTTHAPVLVYSAPAAMWIVRREVILDEFDRFSDVRAGELIAWFAVENGLPGECEGEAPCYLQRDNLLEAEYLRRLPAGALVEMALNKLRERATHYREDLVTRPMLFDRSRDCSDLSAALVPVRAAVASVDTTRTDIGTRRDRALEALDALGAVCRS